MRVAIYARVSTNEQEPENQLRQLRAWCTAAECLSWVSLSNITDARRCLYLVRGSSISAAGKDLRLTGTATGRRETAIR